MSSLYGYVFSVCMGICFLVCVGICFESVWVYVFSLCGYMFLVFVDRGV